MSAKPWGRVDFPDEVVCAQCHQVIRRKAAQQKFCSHACWKAYQYAHAPVKHYAKGQHKQGTVAKALEASCAVLEDQCKRAGLRQNWPAVIARFMTAPILGYRDLSRLTRQCVASKLRVKLQESA